VISHELLAAATLDRAAYAIESLRGADVHVILTVRDFASLLPAEWQETVKHGSTRPWRLWVRRLITAEDQARRTHSRWFWQVHDTFDVLHRWSGTLPRDHVHVVTVPPPGSPPSVLWERFASVIGIDPSTADLSTARPNASLGMAETEMLRWLNAALGPDGLPPWYYAVHVKEALAHGVLAERPVTARPQLAPDQQGWARSRAEKVVAGLQESGYDIVGTLDDLLPAPVEAAGEHRAARVRSPEVLDAAVASLAAVLRDRYAADQGMENALVGLRLKDSRSMKRALRRLTARYPALGRLRVFAWRLTERARARRHARRLSGGQR
jgi:hypothetical protein